MFETQSVVTTPEADRLVRRLCKHWGHKFSVRTDERGGYIDFGDACCELVATDAALTITLRYQKEQASPLETVVAEHLQRFVSAGQTLEFTWQQRAPGGQE